jgi:hypothetical protein
MVNCGNCGEDFANKVYLCRLNEIYKKGNIKGTWCSSVFCSDNCRYEHEIKVHRFICHECGSVSSGSMPFSDNSGNWFCSKECLNNFDKSFD